MGSSTITGGWDSSNRNGSILTPYVAPVWNTPKHPAALAGAGVQAGYGPYGGVPLAANPQAAQAASIQGNISNLPGLQNLASDVNKFQQDQLNAQYLGLNPNFTNSYGQAGTNIAAQLRGEVPADVIRQLQQNAAEFGAGSGISGSRLQGYQGLRALGLTSLEQQQLGQKNLLSLTAGTPIVKPYDITQGFVSPEQELASQQLANNLAAAPDPAAAAANALALAREGQNRGGGGITSMGAPSLGAGKPASQNTLADIISRYSGGGSQGDGWQSGGGSPSPNELNASIYNPSNQAVQNWFNKYNGTSSNLDNSNMQPGQAGNFGGGLNFGAGSMFQDPYTTGSSGVDWSNLYLYGTPSSGGGGGFGPSYGLGGGSVSDSTDDSGDDGGFY